MKKRIHIDHIADICLELYAETLPELFSAGLQSMNDILYPGIFDLPASSNLENTRIKLTAVDTTVLLVDFLSEVLSLSHENKAMYTDLDLKLISTTSLTASLQSRPVLRFLDDIKAVTYHEAEVRKNDEGLWTTRIIFDI